MDLDMRVACAVRVGSGVWGKGADRAVRSAAAVPRASRRGASGDGIGGRLEASDGGAGESLTFTYTRKG